MVTFPILPVNLLLAQLYSSDTGVSVSMPTPAVSSAENTANRVCGILAEPTGRTLITRTAIASTGGVIVGELIRCRSHLDFIADDADVKPVDFQASVVTPGSICDLESPLMQRARDSALV